MVRRSRRFVHNDGAIELLQLNAQSPAVDCGAYSLPDPDRSNCHLLSCRYRLRTSGFSYAGTQHHLRLREI